MDNDFSDFGVSKIEWRKANPTIIEAVESEYKQRLIASAADWSDLDQKARFLFTGLVGLNTIIVGWAFANAKWMESHFLAGLLVLAVMFSVAIMMAALSLWPREYAADKGVTPHDLNVSAWEELLSSDPDYLLELSGVRIKEYAISISMNNASNSAKSAWLTRSVGVLFVAFPAALIFTAAYCVV